jgi:voltage-gated potassium channel
MPTSPLPRTPAGQQLSRAQRRRLIYQGLFRAVVPVVVLIALYYALPLDRLQGAAVPIALAVGLVAVVAVAALEVRAIGRSTYPAIRAIQSLAISAPLFLLLFAATYYVMAHSASNSFNVAAFTRTDSVYFTVTVFSTVGFGDIAPASQAARLIVTTQMILDLLILGLGVRVFVGAVQSARGTSATTSDARPT